MARRLSPEERALWEQVAATATPLTPPPVGLPAPPLPAPVPGPVSEPRAAPRRPAPPRPPPAAALGPLDRAHPHMDRRRFEKLRRGRLEPEARLDLHGMTSERAHAALAAFIPSAHAAGLRLVLVITGKGGSAGDDWMMPQRRGVLRHSLPHWLGAPPLRARILQVAPAHARHGGAGAFYVYLRRQRDGT